LSFGLRALSYGLMSKKTRALANALNCAMVPGSSSEHRMAGLRRCAPNPPCGLNFAGPVEREKPGANRAADPKRKLAGSDSRARISNITATFTRCLAP
jgi:hypothetical protein